MSDATKVLQTGVDTGDGSTYPQPVVVVDAAGNPIDLTKANGAAITSVTAVALAAGAAPPRRSRMACSRLAFRPARKAAMAIRGQPARMVLPVPPAWA